jgi:hypothetical protein
MAFVDAMPENRELFAVGIANGLSYRKAAVRAGFHEDYGFDLMQFSDVKAKIAQLINEPSDRIKVGIRLEMQLLRNRASADDLTEDDRKNIELRLKLLMAHARMEGMIIEKRQVATATLDLGKLDAAAVRSHLGDMLQQLDPGAREEIARELAPAKAIDVKPAHKR